MGMRSQERRHKDEGEVPRIMHYVMDILMYIVYSMSRLCVKASTSCVGQMIMISSVISIERLMHCVICVSVGIELPLETERLALFERVECSVVWCV